MKKIFLIIYLLTYLTSLDAQNERVNADGLFLKYQSPVYYDINKGIPQIISEKFNNQDLYVEIPDNTENFNLLRGELDKITNQIGLTYKKLPQYTISETFFLKTPPVNPIELYKTILYRTIAFGVLSQWIHEDGECILFIKCPRVNAKIDKSIYKFPEDNFYVLKENLNMEPFDTPLTGKDIKKIKKKTKFWSPEKSKEMFNAQYVITYPIKNKKAVFMNRYTHKMDLIMVKWGQDFRVSFLLTKKGYKDRKKYIKDVQEAFWFED